MAQQRAFVLEAGQQELADAQPAVLENRAANQKRLRAGAAGQTRGFEVEETAGRGRTCSRPGASSVETPARPARHARGRCSASPPALERLDDGADAAPSVRAIGGVIAIDDDHRAVWRLDPLPGEDVGHASGRRLLSAGAMRAQRGSVGSRRRGATASRRRTCRAADRSGLIAMTPG